MICREQFSPLKMVSVFLSRCASLLRAALEETRRKNGERRLNRRDLMIGNVRNELAVIESE